MIDKPVTKKRIFLIVTIFLLILTSFRIGWIIYHKAPDQPDVEKGVIDLIDWEFTDDQTVTLDGEWRFYPD